MNTKDFYYELPQELIAQHPLENREKSRLMCMSRKSGEISHKKFEDIINFLHGGDCLVLNDTRVLLQGLRKKKKRRQG